MDIKKHGGLDTPKNIEEFVCENCGCEFTAHDEEYYVDRCVDSNALNIAGYQATVKDIYVCSCPECHIIVKKEKSRVLQNPTLVYRGEEVGIPEYCKSCSNHPSNGGSGLCNCILGSMGQLT